MATKPGKDDPDSTCLANGSPTTPPLNFYEYSCRLHPLPFRGPNKFIAGRLREKRAHKSSLATHTSGWSDDAHTTCPCCRSDRETYEHAILQCSARSGHMGWFLNPAISLTADSTLWDDKDDLCALSQYLSRIPTGFRLDGALHRALAASLLSAFPRFLLTTSEHYGIVSVEKLFFVRFLDCSMTCLVTGA